MDAQMVSVTQLEAFRQVEKNHRYIEAEFGDWFVGFYEEKLRKFINSDRFKKSIIPHPFDTIHTSEHHYWI